MSFDPMTRTDRVSSWDVHNFGSSGFGNFMESIQQDMDVHLDRSYAWSGCGDAAFQCMIETDGKPFFTCRSEKEKEFCLNSTFWQNVYPYAMCQENEFEF